MEIRISIHALREEGDVPASSSLIAYTYFYPRPPRGGRQQGGASTPGGAQDFYPRPPRGGRPCRGDGRNHDRQISIHALREVGDSLKIRSRVVALKISIHALREEGDSLFPCEEQPGLTISIHALREEGDISTSGCRRKPRPISIHALREEGDAGGHEAA